MEQFAYEFNTGRRQQPIEACVSALQDAQAYAIANGNAVDQARLAALEKQVKEIQEKLADVVTKEEFDALAKEAVDTYVQSADLLKDYAKKTDIPDLTDYATKDELEDFVKQEALANYVTSDMLTTYAKKEDLDKKVGTEEFEPVKATVDTLDTVYAKKSEIEGKADVSALDEKASKEELATAKKEINAEVEKKLEIRKVGNIETGTFEFTNGAAGAGVSYKDETRKLDASINVLDGNTNGILAQIVAGPMAMTGPKIFLDSEKATYVKGKIISTADDELVTKKDLNDINRVTPEDLNTRVEKELEGTHPGDVAKIQNQTDGGVMQYVSADKSNSAITVNDGSQNVGAEICSLDPDGKGSRIIANRTGAYYSVGNAIDVTPEKEIAVKGDLAGFVNEEAIENKADKTDLEKYIPINNDKDGNKSYMANEKDGGIIKYIKPDESYAKVTLCNVDEEAVAQIVATNKDKTTFAKIDARKDGICYSKKTGNPNLEEDEIVVKKDLKVYTPAEMEGLNPGDTAVCHNAKDGGSIKYMTETHTAFVGVDNGGDELFAEFALAENKQGKEFKKGNRLLAKKDGIFYTKDANSTTTTPEDEIITKKDITNFITEDAIAEKADKTELNNKVSIYNNQSGNTSLMDNQADGGIMKFIRSDKQYSKVGLWNTEREAGLQLVIAKDEGGNGNDKDIIKIHGTPKGMFYAKHGGDCNADEELVTKADLKLYSAAELTGVKPEHLATCHNAQDGGSLKYETADHTAFIGVNYDNDTQELLAEFALTEKKDGKTLKSGNRLLAKEDGIYYTKSDNVTTTSDNEIVTKADLKSYVEKELSGDRGKALIFNENDGGGAKFTTTGGIESYVGVCDKADAGGLAAQIYADKLNEYGKYEGAKIDITNKGIYYTVGADDFKTRAVEDNEIATKREIKELKELVQSLQQQLQELSAKVNQE